jgi:cytidyltransferase-like protein
MMQVVVTGSFDDLRSRHVRFLEQASKLGDVHVLLWSDETLRALEGKAPKLSEAERVYLLQANRYVEQVTLVTGQVERDAVPQVENIRPDMALGTTALGTTALSTTWVVDEANDNAQKKTFCESRSLGYRVVRDRDLKGFPVVRLDPEKQSSHKKVIVTGCYDWFHSGHVRFFEEVSGLGELYVVVGSDENVKLLKGAGHPMFLQDERRYMVQSVRYVKQALISTGQGWMDAEPEIAMIKPDMYAVNEDGDKPEKREFCRIHGIQYVVLKRTPKEGLPRRQSTDLRGF